MPENFEIRKMKNEDIDTVNMLVKNTIETAYCNVYPPEAIEYFRKHHTKEIINHDADNGYTVVAEYRGEIVGTGTLTGTNIRRVYINPDYQNKGIGKTIVKELEKKACAKKMTALDLSSSLLSREFWLAMGYSIKEETFLDVGNGQRLDYYEMGKRLDIQY